ncbi:MAG: glycoside hydrolase family 97 protein [Alistipes sp.]|nr:glycoside hydrolase family 97 protein [Alistipes sp.]
MRRGFLILVAMLLCFSAEARRMRDVVEVVSPSDRCLIVLDWSDGSLRWSAYSDGCEVVKPSRLCMTTTVGAWGEDVGRGRVKRVAGDEYNAAVVTFDDYAVELRAYDEGVAYRFISMVAGRYDVVGELAEFTFDVEDKAWIPYVNYKPDATSDYATQYYTSFENVYEHVALGDIDWRRLIFTPVVVERGDRRVAIVESNLEEYPGMFLSNRDGDGVLDTEFAPVPDVVEQGDYNMLQGVVKSRKEHIAECYGERTFPWRGVVIAEDDRALVDSRLVWLLADECRLEDTSWIQPGKVAWEWWNDWGLEGVDFEVGINNQTYKYYIDFASRYGIEYVILDEGWCVKGTADLMQVVPEIDIRELTTYAEERGVGLILWAGYWAMQRDIEGLCKHYSEMGIKGFKVDFLDRDDQAMVRFVYDLAEAAARYELLVDYHGVYKPTGLQRTYPNAINFEGVHGLETMKWLGAEHDQLTYDVTIPFVRALAGPMDYTPGAMRNADRGEYCPDYSRPMSQGTRCHQLAMYVVYEQPLAMLCDSPTAYEREVEYTRFLAEIPTTWASRRCLSGEIGEYVVVERVADDGTVYIAGLAGGEGHDVTLSLDFIPTEGTIYRDNPAGGYICESYTFEGGGVNVAMAPGGGFVLKCKRANIED